MKTNRQTTRRSLLAAGVALGLALLAGCGGSRGGGGSTTKAAAPTEKTRSRVQSMHSGVVRGISQSGYQNVGQAVTRNGIFSCSFGSATDLVTGGSGGITGGGGAPVPSGVSTAIPMVGAFLRNVAAVPPKTRAAHIVRISRQEEPPTPTKPPVITDPAPTFYFDYYLGLWVAVTDTPGKSLYQLYEDEAKTKPAGSITTVSPTDWTVYPQIYNSTYEFNAGYLAGSHGFSKSATAADYSGSMSYEDFYNDGWHDKGASNWSGQGDYSWTSRTDVGDGAWTESAGTFRADGSGGTRTTGSDGYQAIYTYNADGSGRGEITGPDPGLPVTISWDAYGNTTITYADGSTEHYAGWGYGGGIGGGTTGGPIPVDGGDGTGATTTANDPPSPPKL